jgi:hypothetical protein
LAGGGGRSRRNVGKNRLKGWAENWKAISERACPKVKKKLTCMKQLFSITLENFLFSNKKIVSRNH